MANRFSMSRLLDLTFVGAAVASVAALLTHAAWVGELAVHFRLQYALAFAVLTVAYLAGRRRAMAMVSLALLLLNAWFVAPYVLSAVVPQSVAATAGEDVSVISLNLLVRNREYAEVRDYLREQDADVLVLSELSPEWVAQLRGVLNRYPHVLAHPQHGAWGLGMYSRYPLRAAEVTDLGVRGSVNVAATLDLPGGDVQLIGVHLVSPMSPHRAQLRNQQLSALADRLGQPRTSTGDARLPRLLVGDMNITPYSPYFNDLLSRTGLADAGRAAGLLGTWPTWVMPLQIRIDHCLADPDLLVARLAKGPIVGSDHYPLEITLRKRG